MFDIGGFFKSILDGMALTDFVYGDGWMRLVMLLIGGVFLFLAIKKNFEPYLLIPIAFGIILVNILPTIYADYAIRDASGAATGEFYKSITEVPAHQRGLLGMLHLGVEHEIYPCLIFLVFPSMMALAALRLTKRSPLSFFGRS